jgi:hypothetical protein
MPRLVVASVLALGISACGLISSDVADVNFNLPSRMYSFDSSMFPVPAGITGQVPCGVGQLVTDCCAPPAGPAPDCVATPIACEQNENGMDVCTATVTVSQGQTMNLGMEVQQLSSYTGFVTIKIKRISYQVTTNTLTIDLPDVILYLGPQGATLPTDAGVMKFGTLPAISAMNTTAGDVILEPNAAQVLASFTSDIKAPFTFIAATTVKVTQSPTGRIDMTITGQLAVSP